MIKDIGGEMEQYGENLVTVNSDGEESSESDSDDLEMQDSWVDW